MTDVPPELAVKARYLFVGDGTVIADGVVTISDDVITSVGINADHVQAMDLGNVALLPGLVNAHTHLELSSSTQPVGHPGMSFPDWIWEIVHRRRGAELDDWADGSHSGDAIAAGLDESRQHGVAVVADITRSPWISTERPELLPGGLTAGCVFLELLGLAEERVAQQIERAQAFLRSGRLPGSWSAGLSPHAPYTVHPDLLAQAVTLAQQSNVPISMHLAESLDEIELLMSGGGHFQQVLADLDAWDPTALPRGTRPLDYLQALAAAPRTLVVHGNFLDHEEIEFLSQHSSRMSVVYCPRTHAYFEHGQYPLAEMIGAGLNVALGTDSRASSPDLSLLAEMRFVARLDTGVSSSQILHMGTAAGARALGIDHQFGLVRAGRGACLTCVELPDEEARDPYDLILHGEGQARSLGDVVADA